MSQLIFQRSATPLRCGTAAILTTLVALFILLSSYGAIAQQYELLPKGSTLQFSVLKNKSKLRGIFVGITGAISFDPIHPEKALFDLNIDATSLITGDAKDKTFLKGASFFSTDHFGSIRLTSKGLKEDGKIVYIMNATLTMKGVSKPVKVQLTTAPGTGGCIFRGVMTINRLDFGLGAKGGDLDNDITFFLEIAAKNK